MMRIPRTIHQAWFGGPIPEQLAVYRDTWRRHHPDWELRCWGDNDFGWLTNQTLFDQAEHHTPHVGQFRADVARYEILHRHGGVWVDMDFECRRPLDELLEDVVCFAAWELDDVWVNNAILGCTPEHAFMADLIDGLGASVRAHRGQRPNRMTGPQYLTPIHYRHDVTVFPATMFYPYLFSELHRDTEDFPDAYAVHHWRNARTRKGKRLPPIRA